MQQKKIMLIGGARPNFMKIAPVYKELIKFEEFFIPLIIHTGQHYDYQMSQVFFDDLKLPAPHRFLNAGSGTHAEQTAKIMMEIEKIFTAERPDLLIVVGDVNSTIAASLTAAKMGIKIAHVEAGLRSFDMTMPEEINRILTDRISDILFTTEISGNINLFNEGVDKNKIHFVGNTMIDTLIAFKDEIDKCKLVDSLELERKEFAVTTLHRPANVDSSNDLHTVVNILNKLSENTKLVFPMHPRTRKSLERHSLLNSLENNPNILLLEPLGYIEFMHLLSNSMYVLTDSGGIQEETTLLAVPCITLRENTERPVTITQGTNKLTGLNIELIQAAIDELTKRDYSNYNPPILWDGLAAQRIVKVIKDYLFIPQWSR